LHQRGYRKMPGPAPLKETLAAGLIAAVKWDPAREPLVDLMCGSGTIVIEAGVWGRQRTTEANPRIYGFDADPEAIIRAKANIAAAQELPAERACGPIELGVARADEATPPAGKGVIVVNAPYGERLHSAPSTVYSLLAQTLAEKWQGWRAAILGPAGASQYFENVPGIRIAEARKIRNGPLLCEMIATVPKGR
jgi:putative N6-adenine-specific DNA methylase